MRASLPSLSNRILVFTLGLVLVFALGLSIPRSSAAQSEDGVKQEILRLERLQWEATKNKDRTAIAAILAKDYFDFGSDGRIDRDAVIHSGWTTDEESLSEFVIEDPQVKLLDDHTALITYRGTYRGTDHGKPDVGTAFYSDLYQKQNGKWLSVFTQDSNLKCAGL